MLEAIKKAHEEIKKICKFYYQNQKEIGKPKFEYKSFASDQKYMKKFKKNFEDRMKTRCTR